MTQYRLSVNLPEEIYMKLATIANITKKTKAEVVIEALKGYLSKALENSVMKPLLKRLQYSALYHYEPHLVQELAYTLTVEALSSKTVKTIEGEAPSITIHIYLVDKGTLYIIRDFISEHKLTDLLDVHYVGAHTLMDITDYLIEHTKQMKDKDNRVQVFLFEDHSTDNIWNTTKEKLLMEFLDDNGDLLPKDKRKGKLHLIGTNIQNKWFTLVRHRKPFIAILGVGDLELIVKYKTFKNLVREFDRYFVEEVLELKFHPVETAIFSREDVIQSYIP